MAISQFVPAVFKAGAAVALNDIKPVPYLPAAVGPDGETMDAVTTSIDSLA